MCRKDYNKITEYQYLKIIRIFSLISNKHVAHFK